MQPHTHLQRPEAEGIQSIREVIAATGRRDPRVVTPVAAADRILDRLRQCS